MFQAIITYSLNDVLYYLISRKAVDIHPLEKLVAQEANYDGKIDLPILLWITLSIAVVSKDTFIISPS